MEMTPRISIAVPVYKVEPYLRKCIDSLLAQTMREIEIILIDDGSPDRCPEICDEYARQDQRIKVIHQENRGLSAARNAAIAVASGEYIMFVDSDDWVEPDFCRIPYETAESKGADMVIFSCIRHKGDAFWKSQAGREGSMTRDEAMRLLFKKVRFTVWNKIYKKTLFSEISFPEGKNFEDLVVMPALIHRAESIYYINTPLYHYRFREGSVTSRKNPEDAAESNEMYIKGLLLLESLGYQEAADCIKADSCFCWNYLLAMGRNEEYSGMCLDAILKLKEAPKAFSWKSRALLKVLRCHPLLFDLICILSGKRVHTFGREK